MALYDVVGPDGDDNQQVVEMLTGTLHSPLDIVSYDIQVVEIPVKTVTIGETHPVFRRALG